MEKNLISIKAARVNAELTQMDVAKHFSVNVNTVSNWERKPDRIPAGIFFDMCELYGCEPKGISLFKI